MKKALPRLQITWFVIVTVLSQLMVGAATFQWNGSSNPDLNWATAGNWTPAGPPGIPDTALFGDAAVVVDMFTVNNVVGANTTITALQFTNATSGNWHVTQIPSGTVLTVSGALNVGNLTGTGSPILVTTAAMFGGGTLIANGTPFNVGNGGSAGGINQGTTLNLSGLSNFVYNAAAGVIGIGAVNRSTAILVLAANSNRVTAATLNLNTGSNSSSGNSTALQLGGETNILHINTINVAANRTSATVGFQTTTGGLRVRGAGGTDNDRTTMVLGLRNTGASAGGTTTGTLALNDHPVDMRLATLTLGQMTRTGTEAGLNGVGVFQFNQGLVDVTTLNMAVCSGNSPTAGARGTMTVGDNGTLNVGSISLGNGTGTNAICVGTLEIAGGIVNCAGNIFKTTTTNCTGNITNTSGELNLGGLSRIGTTALPLDTMEMSDAVLQLTPAGNGTNVVVTTLVTGGAGNIIRIDSMPSITSYPTTLRLIKYSGVIEGAGYNFTLDGLPGVFTGSLVNNSANGSIDLVVTSGPIAQAIKWNGNLSDDWNILTTKNWKIGANSTNYFDGDFVTFDDTAAGPTAVDLTTELAPGSMTVDNTALAYSFVGAGRLTGLSGLVKQGSGSLLINNAGINDFAGNIDVNGGSLQVGNGGTTGNLGGGAISNSAALSFNRSDNFAVANAIAGPAAGTLTKNGTGVLTLNAANTFTGAVSVAQGTLKLGNSGALGRTNGTTTISSGATLDFGANAVNIGQEPVSVSGAGVGGNGAIINSSGSSTFVAANVARVTMTDHTTFGGTGRWDLRSATTTDPTGASLSTGGAALNLTKKGTNQVSIVGVTVDPALANVDVQAGILAFEQATTGLGNPAANLTVQAGATLQFFNATNLFNKVITLNGTGTNNTVNNSSGVNTVIGPITLNGNCIFNAGGTTLILSNTISGAGQLIKSGGNTLVLSGGNDNYTGNTTLSNGTLIVDNALTGGGTLTTLTNTTLGGNGSHTGPVVIGGNLAPGTSAGTFSSGPLTLNAGATLNLELSSVTTVGSGVNDLISVAGNLTANNNSIVINLTSGSLANGTYRLIEYSGSLIGALNPVVTVAGGASRYSLTLDTATVGQVNLVVAGGPASVRWDSFSSSVWDINTTANWFNLGSSLTDTFFQADRVLFDDTLGLVNTIEIATNVSVAPSSITNNSSVTGNNFSIGGAGRITGGAAIVKLGDSTLSISTTNAHSGGLIANGGTVRLTGLSSGGSGLVTVNSGATVVFGAAHSNSITVANGTLGVTSNDFTMATTAELTVPAGTTATIQAADPQNPVTSRNFQIDATLRGSGNILAKNADAIANVDSNQGVRFRGAGASDYSGTITVTNNTKSEMRTSVAGPFSPAGTGKFVLLCGAYDGNNTLTCPIFGGYVELNLRNNTAGDTILGNNIELSGSGAAMLNPLSDTPAPSNAVIALGNLRIGADQELIIYKGSGNPYTVKFNSVTLTGGETTFSPKSASFGAAGQSGSDLWLGDISQLASASVVMNGVRTLTLAGNNNYTGDTTIQRGTLALVGSSSLANSPNITMGSSSAVLDVTARVDGTLSLGNSRLLRGHGTVRGNLTANTGSTVSPGGSSAAGNLAVTGAASLGAGSTILMEVDKAAFTNDSISAASISYNGTLQVVSLGDPFGAGNTFKLFSAGSYGGSFSSINPPTPGAGLVWDTTGLTNGVLKVRSTSPLAPPQILSFASSGNDVTLSGGGGPAFGSYLVLTSTDVGLPAASWTILATNYFDVSGNFSVTLPVDLSNAQRYFLLKLQ